MPREEKWWKHKADKQVREARAAAVRRCAAVVAAVGAAFHASLPLCLAFSSPWIALSWAF